MRINTIGKILVVTGFIIAAGWTAVAQESASLSPVLKAKDVAAAWTELGQATTPPPGPAKWHDTTPTAREKETFYLPYVRALSGKAKDFYTRFPKDENATQAKMMEFRFLFMTTVLWGDSSQTAHLDAVEKSILADPALSDDNHIAIIQMIAQSSPAEAAKPVLQQIASSGASVKVKAAAEEQLTRLNALGHPIDLQFTAVDGRAVNLDQLKGKVVLIDFWATWCGPCVGEVPNVKKTYDTFHAKGFEIVGISLDKDKEKLTQFVADHSMAWPQFFDGLFWQNKYARQFGIESIPTMWLIDKKGNLRDMNARDDLSGGVQKLLAE